MAKAHSKPRPMKSRKNGLKHKKRIDQNNKIIKSIND
jgi:hypothetical protein